jgi:hypothetical protein
MAFIAVVMLAGVLRVAGLGRWSFASDELGTFAEVEQLFGEARLSEDDPDRNVPRLVPLATALHATGYALFGRDEFGSRTLPALFGLAQVIVVGLGLRGLAGRTTAIAAALLLALSPEHLFYSQYNRFYAPAALFGSLAFLAAARAVKVDSARWMAVAVIATLAGILVHALLGLVFGGLAAALLLLWLFRDLRSRRLWIVVLAGALVAALYAALYLYPLGRDKAVSYWWTGYSIPRALLSGVSQVSWPVALFAVPGLLVLWKRDRAQAIFWVAQAAVWAGALVILPRVLPFHSAYVFALNLPLFVLAAAGFAEIADRLSERSRAIAVVVAGCLFLLNLPAVASHYRDGSRHDFRAAAHWIAERIGPDDVIVAVQGDKLARYRPELEGRWHRLPARDIPQFVESRRPASGRVWIVLPGGRGGLPEPWREWAERVGRPQTTIVHSRFDYHEYPIFILLEDRPPK